MSTRRDPISAPTSQSVRRTGWIFTTLATILFLIGIGGFGTASSGSVTMFGLTTEAKRRSCAAVGGVRHPSRRPGGQPGRGPRDGRAGPPATAALVCFVRAGSGWRLVVGPADYGLFVVVMLVVDDWLTLEFRTPPRPEILIPYLVLFFGGIVLRGAPMLRIDRRLRVATAATSVLLLGSMAWALSIGVG